MTQTPSCNGGRQWRKCLSMPCLKLESIADMEGWGGAPCEPRFDIAPPREE